MKTILVPLDGSLLAEQVLPYVCTLAPILEARVHLLRMVVDPGDDGLLAESIAATYGVGEPLATPQARRTYSLELLRQNAERYLEARAALLHSAGLHVAITCAAGKLPTASSRLL